jgi:GT2 family glycosyltransferase
MKIQIQNEGISVKPQITVAIPVCERSAYLEYCLASVAAANPGGGVLQVMVLDNASKNSAEFVSIVSRFPDVQLLRFDERAVISMSFNRCLRVGSGEWIHLLHDDDAVDPDFYHAVLRALAHSETSDAGLLACDTVVIDENHQLIAGRNGGMKWPLSRAGLLRYALGSSPFYCPSVLIARNVANAGMMFDENYHVINDWEYWWRVVLAYPVAFAPGAVAKYRIHLSNTHKSEKYHECYKVERPRLMAKQLADSVLFEKLCCPEEKSASNQEYRQRARRIFHTLLQRQVLPALSMIQASSAFGFSKFKLTSTLIFQGFLGLLLLLFKGRNAYYVFLESNSE